MSAFISSRRARIGSLFLGTLFALGLFSSSLIAQKEDAKPKAKAETKEKAEKKDPFAVPEKGDAAAYVTYIEELGEYKPNITSQAEYIEAMTKIQTSMLKAGELGLAQNPDEKQIIPLLRAKVVGIISLHQLGVREDPKEALTTLEKYVDDKRKPVADFAKVFLKNAKMALIDSLSDEERNALVEDIIGSAEKEGLTRFNVGLVNQLASAMEQSATNEEAAAYYRRFAALAAKSDNEQIAEYAIKLEGIARRLGLPGNKMDVFGKTVAGEKFDWESYRGKVVLVDFWASWCGPCIQELPNVKANYKKYHNRGFEVVGVNLDDDKEKLQSFVKAQDVPWVNIFPEKEEERGWEHPLANHYGITGIPATILVDQEGKVVSLSARGPELGALLEELLGDKSSTK